MATTNGFMNVEDVDYCYRWTPPRDASSDSISLPSPFFNEKSSSSSRPQQPLGKGLIVLTHALMANQFMWRDTVRALQQAGYSTLTFDHIGHGKTAVPESLTPPPLSESGPHISPPQLHFDDITRHMYKLIQGVSGRFGDDAKVKAVIGCSMGGVLCLRFAMLYPEALEPNGRVICCDAPGATSLAASVPKWNDRIKQFAKDEDEGTETLLNATVERWIPYGPDEDADTDPETLHAREWATTFEKASKCSLAGYRLCADGIRGYDYQDQLHTIKAKTMVLAGELDEAIGPRDVTEGIAKAIPGAELVWMPQTGHLPPVHRHQEFEEFVMEFLGAEE